MARKRATMLGTASGKITVTLEADDHTLERLAQMLLFYPLPPEEIARPNRFAGVSMEPDYPVLEPVTDENVVDVRDEVRREITRVADRSGLEFAKGFLAEVGAESVGQADYDQLAQLRYALKRGRAPEEDTDIFS